MNNSTDSGIAKLKASYLPHINCSPSPTFSQINLTCRQGVSYFSSLTVLAAISPVVRAALPPCCHHLSTSLLLPQCDEAVMALLLKFVQGGKVVASLGKCSNVMEMLKMLGVQTKDISLVKHNNEYYEGEEVKEGLKTEMNKIERLEVSNEGVSNVQDLDEVCIVHEMPSSMVRKTEQISFYKVKMEMNEVFTDQTHQSSAQVIHLLKEEKEKLSKELKLLKVAGPTEEKLKVSQERVNSLMLEKIAIQTVSNTWKKRNDQLNLVITSYKSPAEEMARLKEALGKLTKIIVEVRAEKNQLEENISKHAVDIDVVRFRDKQNAAFIKDLKLDLAKARKDTVESKAHSSKNAEDIDAFRNRETKNTSDINNLKLDLFNARMEVVESKTHSEESVIKGHLNTISQIKTSNVQLKKTVQNMNDEINSIENVKNVEVAKLKSSQFTNSQLKKIGRNFRNKAEVLEKELADLNEEVKEKEKEGGKDREEVVQLTSSIEEKDARIEQLMLEIRGKAEATEKRFSVISKDKRKLVEAEVEVIKLKEDMSKMKASVAEKDFSIQKSELECKKLHEKVAAVEKEFTNLTENMRKIKELSTQIYKISSTPISSTILSEVDGSRPMLIYTSPLAVTGEINQDVRKLKKKLLVKKQLFEESESAKKRMKFSSGTNLAKLVISEKLLEATVQNIPISCKYRGCGCLHEDLATDLVDHETECMFRSVQCPGRHQDNCNWLGPLNQLVQHVLQQECVLVVTASQANNLFTSIIDQQRKPVMLTSVEALEYFCYAMFYKDGDGHWVSHVRSFSPPQKRKSLQVEVKIRTADNESLCEQESFKFGVSSNEATEQEIKDSGNCLRLQDDQVKKYIVENSVLWFIITKSSPGE